MVSETRFYNFYYILHYECITVNGSILKLKTASELANDNMARNEIERPRETQVLLASTRRSRWIAWVEELVGSRRRIVKQPMRCRRDRRRKYKRSGTQTSCVLLCIKRAFRAKRLRLERNRCPMAHRHCTESTNECPYCSSVRTRGTRKSMM